MNRAIEKVLNYFGYYKAVVPKGSSLTEAEVLDIFNTYGEDKRFTVFLRDLMANDVRIYFQATNEDDRRTIRGAHQRTNYFLALIRKANDKRKR